jgi:hypothetical protein
MVMFDFYNIQTAEYKNYINFVDIEKNEPKKLDEIKKEALLYKHNENVEPLKFYAKDDFLSKEECEYLVWLADTVVSWPKSTNSFWNERSFGLLTDIPKHHYAGSETAKLILSIHSRVKEFISNSFGKECYADQIGVIRWPPGSYQPPHIDNVPHLSRVAGCVIYLNDDYIGGETFYPYYGKKVSPKAGNAFAHDSGDSHLHGVTQIKEKTRYTISSTWTDNPNESTYERQIFLTQNYLQNINSS